LSYLKWQAIARYSEGGEVKVAEDKMAEGVGKAKARGKRKNNSADCHGGEEKK
jgi:hypothetical protein